MKQKTLLLTMLLVLFSVGANAQLSGSITNKQGDPIPYANIYVEEQMHGTASDGSGRFSLHLTSGTYTVNFRAIGYKPQTRTITLGKQEVKVDISLDEAAYELKEIVVSNKDNPGNRIMRKAISNGQLYLSKLGGYRSDIYFKSNFKFTKLASYIRLIAPKNRDLPKVGKTYTMELVNELTYKAPDSYTQRTLSYRTNLPGDRFEVPGLDVYRSNIYNDQYYDAPSPLGRDAFTCYKYQLIATTVQNGTIIYKIGVAPKRYSGVFFKGFLYIRDNSYEITNAELETINGTLKINLSISYDMVKQEIPLPTSLNIRVGGSMLGIAFSSNMISSVKYSTVDVKGAPKKMDKEQKIRQSTSKKEERRLRKLATIAQTTNKLSGKDNFSPKDMRKLIRLIERKNALEDTASTLEEGRLKVVKDSLFNTQDSTFWNKMRSIPLSEEELKFSRETDSITALIPKTILSANDTLSSVGKWTPKAPFFGGTIYQKGNFSVASSSFFGRNASYFNPVDGYTIANRFTLKTKVGGIKPLSISVRPIYSSFREQLMGELQTRLDFAPRRMGFVEVNARSATADFNLENPQNQMINTIACLYFKESYKKVMDTKDVNIKVQIEVVNGLSVMLGGQFQNRHLMDNHTNHSLFKSKSVYDSNTPDNIYLNDFPLANHSQPTLQLRLNYTPSPRYRIDKDGYKQYTSQYLPNFSLSVAKGLDIWNGASTYTNMEIGMVHAVRINMFNELSYKVNGGEFFGQKGMQFSNFYFPTTAYAPFAFESTKNSFTLLPYYRFATPEGYAEAHVCYESHNLILKRLPFLTNSQFTENITIGYYSTGRYRNYTEIGYGLDKLLFIGGVAAVASFENGRYSGWGIRAYINLSSNAEIKIR